MEKISWTDRVRNEEVLHRVKEEGNILHTIKTRKANWIGHILRTNYSLKHIIGGKFDVKGRRGRRPKQLLYNLKEMSICGRRKRVIALCGELALREGSGSVARQIVE